MKVLITGAFGNLGVMCIEQALALGYDVRCFDICTDKTEKAAQRYHGRVETYFGDIKDRQMLRHVLEGVDGIIHNASLLPPISELNPDMALGVNVEGTRRLIECAILENPKMRFIFPSSVTVFGLPSVEQPLRMATDDVKPTDHYTQHKLSCEALLRNSELQWCILRVGVSVDSRTLRTDWRTFKQLLRVRKDNPLEYVHPKDVAVAMCAALTREEAINRVLLIGGGKQCQVTQFEFLQSAISACGLTLPPSVFGKNTFYTHWLDTEESQRILQYQSLTFSDYQEEMRQALKVVRYFLTPIRPVINVILPTLLKQLVKGAGG